MEGMFWIVVIAVVVAAVSKTEWWQDYQESKRQRELYTYGGGSAFDPWSIGYVLAGVVGFGVPVALVLQYQPAHLEPMIPGLAGGGTAVAAVFLTRRALRKR